MNNNKFSNIPKIALHDHLDGGIRPETLIEIAHDAGVVLPVGTSDQLRSYIFKHASTGSLDGYLKMFGWTVPSMQTAASLRRVAREALEDLAADGIVLAEIRFAPLLHTAGGLTGQDVIDAVAHGLRDAITATNVPAGIILCGIRCNDEFEQISDLFVQNYKKAESLVVGVDLAGPEAGFPCHLHPGIKSLARSIPNAPITIHAGEADGVSSIREAIEFGARRIGHGVRLIDDICADKSLMREIISRDILLEVCLSSNLQTGAIDSLQAHPLRRFLDEGVKVSLDVDNRLMSATTYSREFDIANALFGFGEEEFRRISVDALNASFLDPNIKAQVAKSHNLMKLKYQ